MMRLSELYALLEYSRPAPESADTFIQGVSIDSRTLQPGELFIAIRGDVCDGHDFVHQAMERGAAALIVQRPVLLSAFQATRIPVICVADTLHTLGHLAAQWRKRFSLPVIAITGSSGKTSTRALLESILSLAGPTLASAKSYNNAVGVPLTLLGLRDHHRYAIVEVGTNARGEIAVLTRLIKPTIAMITHAGAAHLEGLGDVAGVAAEKGDIFRALLPEGIAIINADDRFAEYWRGIVSSADFKRPVYSFGIDHKADVQATHITFDETGRASFQLCAVARQVFVSLSLMGKHAVYNALAAAAAALSVGLTLEEIAKGLMAAQSVPGRLVEHTGYAGAKVIDDSYNANPGSVRAAMTVLKARSGVSVLVLGDMAELGALSAALHADIGREALEHGIDYLFCYGPYSQGTADTFGKGACYFKDLDRLVSALRLLLDEQRLSRKDKNITVLVKGSRVMRMDQVVKALLEVEG